tara:strand:+ start:867 stop:1259 length:393 start_codon:yes stop_codon:yes gene_type:complete
MALENVVLIPALVYGGIVALIEIMFVHSDEAGMGWFKHAVHAAPLAIIFVFVNMNIQFVLDTFNLALPFNEIFLYAGVALISLIKIQAAAAIAGKTVGEKFVHTLIIALLIFASPYVYEYLWGMMPSYLQ